MDLTGVQRLTPFMPPASRFLSVAHNSTHNRAAIVYSYDGPARAGFVDRRIRLEPASPDTAPEQWHFHADCFRFTLNHVT